VIRRKREETMQERFLAGIGAIHPETRKRSGFPRWLAVGVLRLLLWVLVVSAICVGLGLLIGHFRGSDPSRSVPVSLYIGGATLMLVSFGGALSGRTSYRVAWDQTLTHDEMVRRYQAGRGVYVLVGVLVVALGFLFDWLL
jgi:hypothetical protein